MRIGSGDWIFCAYAFINFFFSHSMGETYLEKCFEAPVPQICLVYPSVKNETFESRIIPVLQGSEKPIPWTGVSPRILIIVNTIDKNYISRAKVIRETYMQRVKDKESLDLIFLGGPTTDGSPDMVPSACNVDYWEDSCKKADMIVVAYQALLKNGGEAWDWFMFADDDALIIPDNLQRGLMNLEPSAQDKVAVWGSPRCFLGDCDGICGGGGYFMNRKTLMEINQGGDKLKYPTFRDEMDLYHHACGRAGDLVLVEALINLRNIPLIQFFPGNYIWWFKSDEELLNTLTDTTISPWLYHYGAKDRFPFVWEKVIELGSSKNLDD